MKTRTTRRTFLKQLAAAGAVLPAGIPSWVKAVSPNDRLNLAYIGVGGRGVPNMDRMAEQAPDVNVVALCDVDSRYLATAGERFPKARHWTDYRRMFDEARDIDAVLISTPDIHHAHASLMAMARGIHVFTEKPLTYTARESFFELVGRQ